MSETPQIGRNEPCPCGSGKKYKRCCGTAAEPKLGTPKNPATGGLPPEAQEMLRAQGLNPDDIPMDAFSGMMQAFQKLPKAQARKFQSLMQRAMSGEDVSNEMAVLEKQLPPQFQEMMAGMMPETQGQDSQDDTPMSEDEAKKVLEKAIASGQISEKEADEFLNSTQDQKEKKPWFKSMFKKK